MTVDDLRCPSCAAALRPGAAWCSLCHADLRTEAERAAARPQPAVPEPAVPEPAVPEPVGPDPADAADPAMTLASSAGTTLPGTTLTAAPPLGKHARPAADSGAVAPEATLGATAGGTAADAPADPRLAGIDIDSMLAELAKDKDPVISGFNRRFATKTQRTLAVTIGSLVMTGLAFATMFVLGSFIH